MLFLYLTMVETQEERDTFEDFYLENKNFLLNYSNQFLKDKTKAEEAVHEAFLYILENKEKYFKENKVEMRRLITTIVRGKTIDLLRRESRYTSIPFEEVEIFMETKETGPEEIFEEKEEIKILRKKLKRLDEVSRQVLMMKYIEKMTYKEIGEILKIEVKAAEMRVFRAKNKLREIIEKEGIIYG